MSITAVYANGLLRASRKVLYIVGKTGVTVILQTYYYVRFEGAYLCEFGWYRRIDSCPIFYGAGFFVYYGIIPYYK